LSIIQSLTWPQKPRDVLDVHTKKKKSARSTAKEPQDNSTRSAKPAHKRQKTREVIDDQAYAALEFLPDRIEMALPTPPLTRPPSPKAVKKKKAKADKKAAKKLEREQQLASKKAAKKGKEKAKKNRKATRTKERASMDGSESPDDSGSQGGSNSDSDSDPNSNSSSDSNPPSSDQEPATKTRKRKVVDVNNRDFSKLSNHTPMSTKLLRGSKKLVEADIFFSNAFPSLTESTTSGSIAWKETIRANRDTYRKGK
jgi:hypothetical protein